MPPFCILANHKIKMCQNSMKKIMIQKITQNSWNFWTVNLIMRAKKLLTSCQIFRYTVLARTVTKKHWNNGCLAVPANKVFLALCSILMTGQLRWHARTGWCTLSCTVLLLCGWFQAKTQQLLDKLDTIARHRMEIVRAAANRYFVHCAFYFLMLYC